MRFLLDTDAALALIKGRKQAVEWLRRRAPAEVVISAVSKAELYYGARKSERVEHNLGVLHRFFEPLQSLTFDDRARSRDLTLVSLNRWEFSRVAGLRLVDFESSDLDPR